MSSGERVRGCENVSEKGSVPGGQSALRLWGIHLGVVILPALVQFIHKPHTQVPVQPVLPPGGHFLTLGWRLVSPVETGQTPGSVRRAFRSPHLC